MCKHILKFSIFLKEEILLFNFQVTCKEFRCSTLAVISNLYFIEKKQWSILFVFSNSFICGPLDFSICKFILSLKRKFSIFLFYMWYNFSFFCLISLARTSCTTLKKKSKSGYPVLFLIFEEKFSTFHHLVCVSCGFVIQSLYYVEVRAFYTCWGFNSVNFSACTKLIAWLFFSFYG